MSSPNSGQRLRLVSRDDFRGACDSHGTQFQSGRLDPATRFGELAHAAHARLNGALKGDQHTDQEVAAELTACVLMELYELGDRSGNSWKYIQGYASDPIQAVARALDTVQKVLEVLEV